MAKSAELESLGQQIAKWRKFRRMSQGELGNKIGKDRQTIQRVETGNTNPTFKSLLAIARGLDVSLSELMDFEIKDHPKNS